jgi:hypothetical protein
MSGSMPGTGLIHIDEIEPTLKNLENALGVPLLDNVLGSVGKREFSGDIDVAVNLELSEKPAFIENLKKSNLILDVVSGGVIMTKVKIVNYDPKKESPDERPRTGYVQIDFMSGDINWMKNYYSAPYEKDSKYKGVYKNILINVVAMVHEYKASKEVLPDGRPLKIERWMYSLDGLSRVIRTPAQNSKGQYLKRNDTKIIKGPIRDLDAIAKTLNLGTGDNLYSYETLIAAIDKNFSPAKAKKIKDIFKQTSAIKDRGIPDDLKESLYRRLLNL